MRDRDFYFKFSGKKERKQKSMDKVSNRIFYCHHLWSITASLRRLHSIMDAYFFFFFLPFFFSFFPVNVFTPAPLEDNSSPFSLLFWVSFSLNFLLQVVGRANNFKRSHGYIFSILIFRKSSLSHHYMKINMTSHGKILL